MATLEPRLAVRHVGVGAVVVGTSLAALFGLVGEDLPERFDQKQITIAPTGDDGLRIREIVDQDFGSARDRHGYQRVIPQDFGVPSDVEASSPDAPDDLSVSNAFGETTIRIGDPNQTVSGQHRYELEYTYPEARLTTDRLGLDVIGTGDNETQRLEVVVTGMELDDIQCSVGAEGDTGGCELTRDGDVYRAVIEPLEEGAGVTIGADIVAVDRTAGVADVEVAPLPERRSEPNRAPLAAVIAGLGALTGGAVFQLSKRRGRNEVAGVGAADAAFGTGPGDLARTRSSAGAVLPPPSGAPQSAPTGSVRLVADQDMDELATTEFVPPSGVAPWQGAVALRERIDNNTIGAWFSGLAATGALEMEKTGSTVTLSPGPTFAQAGGQDRRRLDALFADEQTVELGKYSKEFADTWRSVRSMQNQWSKGSGWWRHGAPQSGAGAALVPILLTLVLCLAIAGIVVGRSAGLFDHPVGAIVFAVLIVAAVAFIAYQTLLPARTATGSAVAIRTESFRRFLAASEGRHVEWAWKQGLLREYSAWAVALGAADAWQRALSASQVPPVEYRTGPLVVYTGASSFGRSYTPPSSSGGGGGFSGGGFSGGSVGGGGGGGSSGSW